MPTRRLVLGAAGAALAGPATAQGWVDPTAPSAPAPGPDAYGLSAFIKKPEWIERLLREFGEPALLTKDAKLPHATYRLLEGGRRPRCGRIIFDSISGGATIVLSQRVPASAQNMIVEGIPLPPSIQSRPLIGTTSLDAQLGARMRVLLDDRDRFWNGASDPPQWEEITADDQHSIYVTADGWQCVLEARVGSKRHVIVRDAPQDDEWLGQIITAIFGKRHDA